MTKTIFRSILTTNSLYKYNSLCKMIHSGLNGQFMNPAKLKMI